VSAGFASREFFKSRLISRQVASSVYVGEKVSDFTQAMRSAAGNVDQFLLSSSRVRCSVARQLFNLSVGVWPNAIEAAARQLAVTSQLGTPSATAVREMKLTVAAIILLASIPASFADNFTPIPKNKIVQLDCSFSCQATFDTCVRVRGTAPPPPTVGTQQVATPVVPQVIGPNCESDRDACFRGCSAIRSFRPPG